MKEEQLPMVQDPISNMPIPSKEDRVRQILTPKERAAYYQAQKNLPLSPSKQCSLFELFLNGQSTEAIANQNKMPLGEVVRARIDWDWDQRKDEHVAYLLGSVRDRVRQIQLESISFSADLLSAAHKLHGGKIRAYIQSGNEEDLGDLKITNLKAYKDAVELLMKLTGQDKEVTSVTVNTPEITDKVATSNGTWTQEQAAEVLKLIELKQGGEHGNGSRT